MNRFSKLPIRSSQLLEPGFSTRESRLSRHENRRTGRASSTSRVSNTTGTPSLRRSKSSISLMRTPQSVSSSHGSRAISCERNKIKKKDDRPIQDKAWQAEQLQKTQHYFQADVEGSQILNQGKNLRPMTIKMFIQLVNIIFNKIDEKFDKLTTTNYVELLPKQLSKLMYPGSVTSSMMKTANTMHTWPCILAILSWLVDLQMKMERTKAFIQENLFVTPNHLSNSDLQELLIVQAQSKVTMAAFVKWNQGLEQEEKEEFEKFEGMIMKICKVDDSAIHQGQKTIDQLNRLLKTYGDRIVKQNEDIQEEQAEYDKTLCKKNYIEDVIQQQKDYITSAEQKLMQLRKDHKILSDLDKANKLKLEKLEAKVKSQPMTKQEEQQQLRLIEGLIAKRDLYLKEQKHQQKISDETDIRISQLKLKIDENVSAYNMSLMQPSLKYPELKECMLESGSVLSTEFHKDVENKSMKLNNLQTDLEDKLKHDRQELATIQKEYQQKQKDVDEIIKQNKEMKKKTEDLKRKTELLAISHEQKKEQTIKKIEAVKDKCKELEAKFPDIDKLTDEVEKKAEEYFTLKKRCEDRSAEMVKFWEALEKEIIEKKMPEYQAARQQITESFIARRKRFEDFLKKQQEKQ